MTPWYVYPLAYLVGILFNLNPSCGSATMVWMSTLHNRRLVAIFALIRITLLACIGAVAALYGTAMRPPWGILMIVLAIYLLYSTTQQVRAGQSCTLPKNAKFLPWVLAFIPPPSGYIGLALFFGGFTAPTPGQGATVLALVGFGLTTPVWAMIVKPTWWDTWQRLLTNDPKWYRTQITFQYLGGVIFLLVGLAFIFLHSFHRPLLELIR